MRILAPDGAYDVSSKLSSRNLLSDVEVFVHKHMKEIMLNDRIDNDSKIRIIEAIKTKNDKDALESLTAVSRNPGIDLIVRARAAKARVVLNDETGIEDLTAMLHNLQGHLNLRGATLNLRGVMLVLASIDSERAVNGLVEIADDQSLRPLTRDFATIAMGESSNKRFTEPLLARACNPATGQMIRANLLFALKMLKDRTSFERLLGLATNNAIQDGSGKAKAIDIVKLLADKEDIESLVDVVCNQNNTEYVRKVSCDTLEEVVDENVKNQVVNKLAAVARNEIINDQGVHVQNANIPDNVRIRSVYVLGATQKKAAVKALFEIAHDENIDDSIRIAAFSSIGISGDKTSAPRLAEELPQHSTDIQFTIIKALDHLDNTKVKEILEPMLSQQEVIDRGVRSDLAKLVDKWSYER